MSSDKLTVEMLRKAKEILDANDVEFTHFSTDPPVCGVLDSSPSAKTTPQGELMILYHPATKRIYRQVKKYKGMYCLGVEWEVEDNG